MNKFLAFIFLSVAIGCLVFAGIEFTNRRSEIYQFDAYTGRVEEPSVISVESNLAGGKMVTRFQLNGSEERLSYPA